jgi:hypothetical protein
MWNLLKFELEIIFGKLGETAFIGSKLIVVGLSQILCINNMKTLESSFSMLEGVVYWKMFYLELYHSFETFYSSIFNYNANGFILLLRSII